MSLWILSNTVSHAAAQVVATDTSDTAITDQSKVGVVRGGDRYLRWTSDSATAARRLAYVNKSGNLSANFCVVVDADVHEGQNLKIVEFSAYPGTESNLYNATLSAADFVGPGASDFVYKFATTQSSKQGFAVEFGGTTYQKTARQVYFSLGVEFEHLEHSAVIKIQRSSIHEPGVFHEGQFYKLWGTVEFNAESVSRATLETYLELQRKDPWFLYDSSGSSTVGKALDDKLLHVIPLAERIVPLLDDFHRVEFVFGVLRYW